MTVESATDIIEITITHHSHAAGKWDYDYYGNRDISSEWGTTYYYQHAKFRLPASIKHPRGKPKCERLDDKKTPEEVLAYIQKKYQPFKFKLNEQYLSQSKTDI